MAIRQIVQVGDPVLTVKAKKVDCLLYTSRCV